LARTCQNRGLETLETTLEDCDLPDASISVVAAFEVLEHLFDPADLVRSAARLLQPGGLLVLSCPNVRGFDVATLGPKSGTIDHEHVNYLHPESLAILLERCGMTVLQTCTPGRLDADIVRTAALAGEVDLSQQPLLRRILIEEWDRLGTTFQQFLAAGRLSGHMWAAARKPAVESAKGNSQVSQT
jgi:SAM-dependent methyltransferase